MGFADHRRMRKTPLEELATVHPPVTHAAELFEKLKTFGGAGWAFRGQGKDWPLASTIERYSRQPGIAEDYAMRAFRRRIHHYSSSPPQRDNDLEWLALMQHHGAPTRLLDWTRSADIAAFFGAESSVSASPLAREPSEIPQPFVIWALDTDSINAEAKALLDFSPAADLSSPGTFHKVFWSQPPEGKYLVMAVEPFRLNERLSIQRGLFLCANYVLRPFHDCLAALLLHAKSQSRPSAQWLHKVVVAPEARADVLRSLDQVNINARTLFPSLDGFCRSLQVGVQLEERDEWPGVQVMNDREDWVKGT